MLSWPARASRRTVALGMVGAFGRLDCGERRASAAQNAGPRRGSFDYPTAWSGGAPGDGFFQRVAYACENARFYLGWWHTGENWHALDGETAGAEVLAVSSGDVVFAGYDYPGAVVIVQHGAALFSQYGHLDYALDVEVGESVGRGQRLGTILRRADDPQRSHLHFELRTFLRRDDVNGSRPRYGVGCGFECPPGPGYWPIEAPEHPSDLGYLNPTHAIARRAFANGPVAEGAGVIVAAGAPEVLDVWSAEPGAAGFEATVSGRLAVQPGDRFALLDAEIGPDGSTETGADAYRLWYLIEAVGKSAGWVRAAVPTSDEVGSDGRPATIRFALLPAPDR